MNSKRQPYKCVALSHTHANLITERYTLGERRMVYSLEISVELRIDLLVECAINDDEPGAKSSTLDEKVFSILGTVFVQN